MSLAFLPIHEVLKTFLILAEFYCNTEHKVQCLIEYFQRIWMQDVKIWNVFQENIRTNNDIEGWHFRIRRSARLHSDVYSFFHWMQEEEAFSRHLIVQSDNGKRVKRAHRKYILISQCQNS